MRDLRHWQQGQSRTPQNEPRAKYHFPVAGCWRIASVLEQSATRSAQRAMSGFDEAAKTRDSSPAAALRAAQVDKT